MPRELYDESGAAVQVPDEAELAAQQQKVDEANARLTELEAEKKKLEEEANPNWKKMRENLKNIEKERDDLKDKLKKSGQETEADKPLTRQEMEEIAGKKAKEIAIQDKRDELLSRHDMEARKVVEHYYEKLAQGEELTTTKVEEIVLAAEKAAGIVERRRSFPVYGRPPVTQANTQLSNAAKEMGQSFGLTEKDLSEPGDVITSQDFNKMMKK